MQNKHHHSGRNKQLVHGFINQLWNGGDFSNADEILHPDYRDHSFPPQVPPTKQGLQLWIENTSKAFDHHTSVESMTAEEDAVAVRIRFTVKHIGVWRGIEPTGKEVTVKGFRFFHLKDGRIASHHALIDGEALQTALLEVFQGCEMEPGQRPFKSPGREYAIPGTFFTFEDEGSLPFRDGDPIKVV